MGNIFPVQALCKSCENTGFELFPGHSVTKYEIKKPEKTCEECHGKGVIDYQRYYPHE